MATFAIVKSNKVSNIVVCESLTILKLLLPNETLMKETATSGIAWTGSDVIGGKFKPPQPFDSWTFDYESFVWVASSVMPNDGKPYYWNESELAWVEIIPSEPDETPE